VCVRTPRGAGCVMTAGWWLPAAGISGRYLITTVNPCNNPTAVEVVDIEAVPGSTAQVSNAMTGERQCGRTAGRGQVQPGSGPVTQMGADLLGCHQSRVGCVQHLQSRSAAQPHAVAACYILMNSQEA